MKASERRDTINRLVKAMGSDLPEVTTADQVFWERNKRLKAATDAITDLQIGEKPEREAALADIPTTDKHTVSDLPETVANALRQPYGSLGLDDSPTWGPTTSPWFIFQHAAEDFMRGKLSRAKLRKMPQTAERLELAIGCLQWARTCAAWLDADPRRASAQFEAAFTSSLILDRDATAELNGETIDIPPSDTKCPIDKAVLMQILEGVKELQAGQADIKTGQEEIKREVKAGNGHKPKAKEPSKKPRHRYPTDKDAVEILTEAAKRYNRKEHINESMREIMFDIARYGIGQGRRSSQGCVRMLYGKLKGTKSDAIREKSKPTTPDKAAKTWQKHLSAFIREHPTYQRKK